MNYNNFLRATDAALINVIGKAINGEYSGLPAMKNVAKTAPNEDTRTKILEIRNDEIRHFQVFSKIYTILTGRNPRPFIVEQCPSDMHRLMNKITQFGFFII
jgi:rubrerythrin